MEIKFSELKKHDCLRSEIKAICDFKGGLHKDHIRNKNCVYAVLDDNQFLGDDAINLSYALECIGVNFVLAAWAADLQGDNDINVEKNSIDVMKIEKMQSPGCRIDHMDSIFFSEYPLRFLIIRPDTCQDSLYLAGPVNFVKRATKASGWKFVAP